VKGITLSIIKTQAKKAVQLYWYMLCIIVRKHLYRPVHKM